jgi:hypothetical protein
MLAAMLVAATDNKAELRTTLPREGHTGDHGAAEASLTEARVTRLSLWHSSDVPPVADLQGVNGFTHPAHIVVTPAGTSVEMK